MHNVCRFSPRWHQQFCHSPSFAGHYRCLPYLTSVRQYRSSPRTVKQSNLVPSPSELSKLGPKSTKSNRPDLRGPSQRISNDLVVREYEQVGQDEGTRVRIKPNRELRDEAAEARRQIESLEQELKILRQGPFGPQSDFMQSFPEDKREILLKALADEGVMPNEEEDALDMAEIDRMFQNDKEDTSGDSLAVTLRVPKAHRAYVNRFNDALEEAQKGNRDSLKNLNLWKWYLRCQQRVPNFANVISERVWKFLWQTQTEFGVRPRHIVMLAQDMTQAGEPLTDDQWLEYIRCLHSSGDTATALHVWEERKSQLTENNDLFSTFYSTGVQLYASLERPMKAQNVCSQALKQHADPRILVHVISAWANDKSPDVAVKAWSAYLKMRSLLGDSMQSELYEQVSNVFLDANQQSMALAVFKDLVASVRGDENFNLQTYQQALGSIEKDQDPAIIEKRVNEISLATLLVLPKGYNNKYFFASWIKKLIGQTRIDAAAMVVDLMYERNIKPDAIHLNGIIGGWLREGDAQSRQKAETLAWDMIRKRLTQVQQRTDNKAPRQMGNVFRKVVQIDEDHNIWLEPIRNERPTPQANTETFSLLLDYYERRSQWSEFDRTISTMLGTAQLRPNIFIVNKLLRKELSARLLGKFWELYNGLKEDIRPNLETFSLLWRAAGLHFAPRYEADKMPAKNYPSSRQLFHDMAVWFGNLNRRDAAVAREEFGDDIYSQIIKCFCYQMDIAGTICAMQGLHQLFQTDPDDISVRLITGQVARLLPQPQPEQLQRRGRTRFNPKLASNRSLLKDVADIVETLEEKHKFDLVESGKAEPDEVEDPDSEASRAIRLDVMTEFLILMMNRTKKEGENPTKTIRDVARVMDVDLKGLTLEVDLDL